MVDDPQSQHSKVMEFLQSYLLPQVGGWFGVWGLSFG